MAGKIFINYRRDDSIGMAGRLHDRLAQAFGPDNIFMDVDNIPVGEDFVAHLNSQVAACDVVLAVIGPTWLRAKDKRGERRLHQPDDWVAIELVAAFTRNVRVIPILVEGTRMPRESELPDSLKPLARRQAAEVRHAHFGKDAEALVARMREAIAADSAAKVRLEAEAQRKAEEEQHQRQAEAKARQQAEEEPRRLEAEAQRKAEEEQHQRQAKAKARREAEEERKRQEAEAKRLADEEERRKRAEAEVRWRAEEERGRQEAEAKPQSKQAAGALVARVREAVGPRRWRVRAAIGAAAVALLLLIGWGGYAFIQHMQTTVEETREAELKAGLERQGRAAAEEKRKTALKADEESKAKVAAAAAVAQKVVLYDEDANDPQGRRYVGSALWRTETVSPGPGLAPELAVRADIEIPERKLRMTWSLRRNTDKALPASHTIEIMFTLPADFPEGGIVNVPGVLMKQSEQARGVPLAGLAVKVTNGYFFIGLSAVEADQQRNIQLFKERDWFDIPIVYTSGKRAILAMEKGTPGAHAFEEAFRVWRE